MAGRKKSPESLDGFISVAEAAEMKKCTAQAIRKAIKRQVIAGQKFGKTWVIHRSVVDKYTPKRDSRSKRDLTE